METLAANFILFSFIALEHLYIHNMECSGCIWLQKEFKYLKLLYGCKSQMR